MMGRGKSWVEVSERRLEGNFKELRRAAGADMAVLSVVKADAYGHGVALCSAVLAAAGASWLGVTDAAEGALVQDALLAVGVGKASEPGILILCGLLPEDADTIVARGLTAVVWNVSQMEMLAAAVERSGNVAELPVHLEIDTGMSRQGVVPDTYQGAALNEVLRWLRGSKRLRLDGVLTHFASAEVVGSRQTADQRLRFEVALEAVQAMGLRPEWIHAGNTSAVDNPGPAPEPVGRAGAGSHGSWLRRVATKLGARPMVRAGLALYGYSLPLEMPERSGELSEGTEFEGLQLAAAAENQDRDQDRDQDGGVTSELGGLAPVMTWKTRVIGVSEIGPGARVGYNGTFVARRRMRLALLPVGYADGLRRELSSSDEGGGWVVVRGLRASVVGRVSMNLTMVDVTGIEGVAVGDEVTLLGEGITAEDHAVIAGTIAYEILCGVRATSRWLVRG